MNIFRQLLCFRTGRGRLLRFSQVVSRPRRRSVKRSGLIPAPAIGTLPATGVWTCRTLLAGRHSTR